MKQFKKLDLTNTFTHNPPKRSSLVEAIIKGGIFQTKKFGKKNCLTKKGMKELMSNRRRFGYCHPLKKVFDHLLSKSNNCWTPFPLSFLTETEYIEGKGLRYIIEKQKEQENNIIK